MTEIQVERTAFAVTITATTPVAAPPERVWEVLTDTGSYPDWNPFVRRLEGELVEGARIEVDLQPNAKEPTTMKPRVVEVVPGHAFTWVGKVGVRGILDGRHTFSVEADPAVAGSSVLVQHERLSGLLTPLFTTMLTVETPEAFRAANDALAARVLATSTGGTA
jgi:hypothetical protein